jgi:hypothetical protein
MALTEIILSLLKGASAPFGTGLKMRSPSLTGRPVAAQKPDAAETELFQV